ncbi:MAG: UDP-2,3-diacylglucosamine diphosphatase LpxI domain-containing protein [Devosia sp.]
MAERLVLIAGSGALVPEVIAAARNRGYELRLLTLGRRRDLRNLDPVPFSLADPQSAVDAIRAFGATSFVMAGGVSISDVARERLARFFRGGGRTDAVGDAGLSGLATDLARLTGARLVGVHEIAPELVAPEGHLAGPEPTDLQRDAAVYALSLARRAGGLDLGQAVVVAGRRAIAAEDIAGTDALLARVQRFRRLGLSANGASPLVLAKCAKPDQPMYVDLPAIGPVTVVRARRAGIGVIAVQAGATLLIERARLVAIADGAGITILGLAAADA